MRVLWSILLILVATATHAEDHNWHVMSTSVGGKVSLISHLTHKEALFMRARLLGLPATPEEEKAEEQRLLAANPPCPHQDDVIKTTDAEWKSWEVAHPFATGCTFKDGVLSWGGGHMVTDGDIKSVEVFQ